MDENLVKIRFEVDRNDWHGHDSERLWAEPVAGAEPGSAFRLRNSPYFTRGISYLDVVSAVPRADGGPGLQFTGVIERSGNSTYMLLVAPEQQAAFEAHWPKLRELGCTYESITIHPGGEHRELYSVDVPATSDVAAVCAVLEEGERLRAWVCHEGHFGHKRKRWARLAQVVRWRQ